MDYNNLTKRFELIEAQASDVRLFKFWIENSFRFDLEKKIKRFSSEVRRVKEDPEQHGSERGGEASKEGDEEEGSGGSKPLCGYLLFP